jgi:hypothetical protein
MILRQLQGRALAAPPDGAFSIAVARHMLPGSGDPRIAELHAARSEALHSFVSDLELSDVRWGDTDASHPREIVEIVVPIASALAGAAASIIAAWISKPRGARSAEGGGEVHDTPIAGIKIKRGDGAELYIDHRMGLEPAAQQKMVETFLAG